MKIIMFLVSILIFDNNIKKDINEDYENKLSEIVSVFKSEIMDKNECYRQKRAVANLVEEIELEISKNEEYNPNEILELKKIKNEAKAIEQFIAVVGDCGGQFQNLNSFYIANRRIDGDVSIYSKQKNCVDFFSVTIGNYIAYLVENNSSKNYRITYQWKIENDLNMGNGDVGLSSSNIRHIYNNRGKVSKKNISISRVFCKEF
jgi:hypothetical protein